jgi:hypothetical protein
MSSTCRMASRVSPAAWGVPDEGEPLEDGRVVVAVAGRGPGRRREQVLVLQNRIVLAGTPARPATSPILIPAPLDIPASWKVSLRSPPRSPRYELAVWLAAGIGLRKGEALGLTVPRVDFLSRSSTGASLSPAEIRPAATVSHRDACTDVSVRCDTPLVAGGPRSRTTQGKGQRGRRAAARLALTMWTSVSSGSGTSTASSSSSAGGSCPPRTQGAACLARSCPGARGAAGCSGTGGGCTWTWSATRGSELGELLAQEGSFSLVAGEFESGPVCRCGLGGAA